MWQCQTYSAPPVRGTRANVAGRTDVYRLARSPVQVADAMTFFRRKVSGGMGFEPTMLRAAYRVRLQLRVRKWFCRNRSCHCRIFTERLPTIADPWARSSLFMWTCMPIIRRLWS